MNLSRPTPNNMSRNLAFAAQDAAAIVGLARGERLAPYIGLVGYGNLGDEVLYRAHQALFPDHRLMPYRKDSFIVEKGAKLIRRSLCPHAVLGGGTLINDGDGWLKKTEHLLDGGSRMFCIGTGAESSAFYGENDVSNELLKRWVKALARFEFVGVRGPRSKAILERAGAKDITVTGDTALVLTEEKLRSPRSQGLVGITYGDVPGNPMWGNPAQYRAELVKVIKGIISAGSKVVLLPIWNIDIPSNKTLLKMIDSPNCTMIEANSSLASFSGEIKKCDIFVGQKLHATIIALMNGVPSVMIEYRPKCRDFMASLGLEDYIIKTSDFRLKDFMSIYNLLEKRHVAVKLQTQARILEYKQLQIMHAKRLSSIFTH